MKRKTGTTRQPRGPDADYDEAADPARIVWLLKELRAARREDAAWQRLGDILERACLDPEIAGSRAARFFARALAEAAKRAASGADAWKILDSRLSAVRAELRGAAPREWVRERWKAQAVDYEGNKSAFAADYGTPDRHPEGDGRGLVWNEFKVRVSARTIRDRWLKDC